MGCSCKQAKSLSEVFNDNGENIGMVKTNLSKRLGNWLISLINRLIVIALTIICIPIISIDLIISFCIYGKLTVSSPRLLIRILRRLRK